jgi:hypothetical protein
MCFDGNSNNTQQTQPDDLMSTVLAESCVGDPTYLDPTDFLGFITLNGTTLEIGSRTGDTSLGSRISVAHKGWLYSGVKKRDCRRGALGQEVGRVILPAEVQPLQEQKQRSEKGSKEVSGKLGDWPAFRQQCKTLDDEVQANAMLAADLKGYIKGCLHSRSMQNVIKLYTDD